MADSIIKLDLTAEGAEPLQGEANQPGGWIWGTVFVGSLLSNLIFYDPNIWLASLQLSLPWVSVGLALCFPQKYRLFPEFSLPVGDQERRPYLLGTLFISFSSLSSLDPMSIPSDEKIVLILLFAAALGGMSVFCEWRAGGSPAFSIVVLPLFIFYGVVAVYDANCVLDRSPAVVRRMVVARKITGIHSESVDLEPVSAEPQHRTELPQQHFAVSRPVFHSLRKGELACVEERNGLLGMPWSIVQVCRGTQFRR